MPEQQEISVGFGDEPTMWAFIGDKKARYIILNREDIKSLIKILKRHFEYENDQEMLKEFSGRFLPGEQ